MRPPSSPADKQYSFDPPPVERKTLCAAIAHFLEDNVSGCKGKLMRDLVASELVEIVDHYLPATERIRAGQTVWYAVDVNETSGYGKRIEDCQIVPVILDLIKHDDIEACIQGVSKKERMKTVVARIHRQAFEQGGVLTSTDSAAMLKLSPHTIGIYIREIEKETGIPLPRRGNVHDMGPTLTHKRIICLKHLKEGKTVEQTAMETHHSPEAVTRYVHDFKRVHLCLKEGMEFGKIPVATGLSKGLVNQYVDIIDDWKESSNNKEEK